MTYKVWDISYDTDGDVLVAKELPTELYIDITPEADDQVDEMLGDAISEITGFCHFGFKYGSLDEQPIAQ